MFQIDDDMTIYITRGDTAYFTVTAENNGVPYKFQPGDVVRIKVFAKKDATNVAFQKDFPVLEEAEKVDILLAEQETKIGDVISKPVDYWYEIELNPYTNPQTIIGYDDDGAKIFRLFPEGRDLGTVTEEEDVAVMDSELSLTSQKPVENQAITRAMVKLSEEVKSGVTEVTEASTTALARMSEVERELVTTNARITNLATLSEGSTTGDAELVDIRTGANGTVYANAGESVRGQISDLKSDLGELSERTRNLIDKSKIIVGNILKGTFESGDKYVTDYISVKPNTAYTVSGNCSITGNEIAWYDADKNYIERTFNSSFITSSNVYYVRLEFNPDVALSEIEVQLDEGAYSSEYIPYMNSVDRNFRELVATPSMYGAKGNGLTDDTACFTEMLAQSKVVKSDKTKEYKITNVLEIASDTVIRDIVFVDATENGIFYANGKENITIENVKVICTDTTYKSDKKLFNFENCTNVKVLNVEIIDTNASKCVWFNACDTVTVERAYINLHYEFGIGCEGDTSNILIRKCRILNNRSAEQYNYSICTYVVYGEKVTTTGKNIIVEDNYIEDFGWTGIDSHGGYNIRVSGNTLVTNTGKGFYGINIGDSRAQCENVLITNNIIEGKKNSKYYAIAFSTIKDIIVSDNVIKSWSYNYDADAQPIIFYGSDATNVCIENNLVDDFRCQLANVGSRDILFKNNRVIFYNTTVGYFNDILFILKGAGALEFIGNSISKFEKMGVLESNGSYNPHPIVKGNTLTPSDVASVGNYVTSTDNVTVEDYKYTEEEVSSILYGLLNDEIITKADADGKYHKYVCTKSFYTKSNPANWAKVY